MQVTYSLVFRIIKDKTYDLYQALSTGYEGAIIASINVFIDSFRVFYQLTLLEKLNNNQE